MVNFVCLFMQAREKQEELAMDMKILDKILRDTENEATEDSNRKVGLNVIGEFHLSIYQKLNLPCVLMSTFSLAQTVIYAFCRLK